MILPFQRPSYIERAVATLPGLVACWPLNDGVGSAVAKDYLGVNHGTISATGVTPGLAGPLGWDRQNGAMGFDGSSGVIALPNAMAPLSYTAFTLTFWSKGANDGGCIFYREDTKLYVRVDSASDGIVRIRHSQIGDGTTILILGALNGTAWHFVALGWDGANTSGYRDSVAGTGGEAATGTIAFVGNYPPGIGRIPDGAPGSLGKFSGSLSTVSLYNRALTPGEVQGLYLSGIYGV